MNTKFLRDEFINADLRCFCFINVQICYKLKHFNVGAAAWSKTGQPSTVWMERERETAPTQRHLQTCVKWDQITVAETGSSGTLTTKSNPFNQPFTFNKSAQFFCLPYFFVCFLNIAAMQPNNGRITKIIRICKEICTQRFS